MKKFLYLFLILFSCFSLISCNSTQKKQNKIISQNVYGVEDSIVLGRFDLAAEFSKRSIQIVPPPAKKDRIVVKPFKVSAPTIREKSDGQTLKNSTNAKAGPISVDIEGKYFGLPTDKLGENIVVLPPQFQNIPVIVKDSPEFKQIILENVDLKKQMEFERAAKLKLEEKVNDILREKEKIVEDSFKPQKGWFDGLFSGFKLFGILGVVGAGVLCVIFPGLIPLFLQIASTIFGVFRKIINFLIEWAESKWKK